MFLTSRLSLPGAFLCGLLAISCSSGSQPTPQTPSAAPVAKPAPVGAVPVPAAPAPTYPEPSDGSRVVLLFVSDLHGQLRSDPVRGGGYARLSTLFHQEKANADSKTDVFVVAGGDAVGKSAFPCRKSNEKACVPLLKDIGIDLAGLGNGELKRPVAELNELIRLSGIPWTNDNVSSIRRDAPAAWQADYRFRGARSGADWTFVNWTISPSPGELEPKAGGYAYTAAPSADWFQRFVKNPKLRGRPVVWMPHEDLEMDQELLKSACATPGLPNLVLLKAHTHEHLEERSQCVPMFEPGAFGQWVSKLVFEYRPQESRAAEPTSSIAPREWKLLTHEFIPVDGKIAEDPAIKSKIDDLYRQLAPEADEVMGQVQADRSPDQAAQWFADIYRKVSHADLAIVNAGAVKDGFSAGSLTRERLLTAIPYNNQLMGSDIGWAELSKALCKSAARAKDHYLDSGSELVFSGGRLVGVGTPDCHLETPRRARLKIVLDSYLIKRSPRWMGVDLAPRAFKFGMDTERALIHGLKLEGGKL